MIIQVCVGSSCFLKGSEDIVKLFNDSIKEYGLEDDVVLVGSFCIGKCDCLGVKLQIDDDVYTNVTKENFREFFKKNLLDVIEKERK